MRLFLGLQKNGYLNEDSIAVAKNAVVSLKEQAVLAGAEKIYITATSATRDAKNRTDLEAAIFLETGLHINIISGKEEALLSYLGAACIPPTEDVCGVIDLGGGSTEIAIGQKDQVHSSISLQLGAARLFASQSISSPSDIDSANKIALRILEGLHCYSAKKWVMVGGTGSALARLLLRLPYEVQLPDICSFTRAQAQEQLLLLSSVPRDERQARFSIPASRVDILPTGLVILLSLMAHLHIEEVHVSYRNNTDGFLYRLTKQQV